LDLMGEGPDKSMRLNLRVAAGDFWYCSRRSLVVNPIGNVWGIRGVKQIWQGDG
jgi:hypothetical protein